MFLSFEGGTVTDHWGNQTFIVNSGQLYTTFFWQLLNNIKPQPTQLYTHILKLPCFHQINL